jgi:hypothetical protein
MASLLSCNYLQPLLKRTVTRTVKRHEELQSILPAEVQVAPQG